MILCSASEPMLSCFARAFLGADVENSGDLGIVKTESKLLEPHL